MRQSVIAAVLALSASAPQAGELMRVVTEPTAGMLSPRTYYVDMSTFPTDGLRFGISVGVLPRLMAGVSYGGWDVTGMDAPEWFDRLSLSGRFRFVDETVSFPALAVGYSNEREPSRAGGRFNRLSRGLYLALSKNFAAPGGDMAFHGGISISFDDPDHAGCWLGVDKSLPAGFGIAADWDPATNEPASVRFDETGGFLNLEGYWQSFGQVRISIQIRDLFEAGGETYRCLAVDFLGLI
ncbi:MAG TPA: hypothetical protein PLY71_03945 [Candidatus Fermentibacter daniensis]|nr:hypothetical protein [Candidatus Fermentibacter daniensis]